ncbi:MAG: NusA N-terminal domain-containing protein [Brevinematia bacterium]
MLFDNIKQIAREMDLPEETVHDMIYKSILAGYKKHFGDDYDNLVFKISEDGKTANFMVVKKVVENVKNPVVEISLKEAKKYKGNVNIGDSIEIPFKPDILSRQAVEVVKSTFLSLKSQVDRDKVRSIFQPKIGDIVEGRIGNIKNRNIEVIIDLGNMKVDGIIPSEHTMPEDTKLFKVGDVIKAVLIDIVDPEEGKQDQIKRKTKDSRLILSRTVPSFIERLFFKNIPEVSRGIVEVKAIGRIPGEKSKVAVYSKYPDVDPVGACIGVGGSRILSVSREISGEKIDVVLWSPDLFEFAKNVFGKYAVHSVEDRPNEVILKIFENNLSVLGRNSINSKLFSQMIGKEVKVMSVGQGTDEVSDVIIEESEVDENTYIDYLPFDRGIIDKLKSKGIKTIGDLIENINSLKSKGFTPGEVTYINQIVNEYIEVEVEEE